MLGPAAGRRRVKDEHEPIFFVSPRARLGRAWLAPFLPPNSFLRLLAKLNVKLDDFSYISLPGDGCVWHGG